MKSICNYKQEEQVNILATLKVVQDKGWSAQNQDPLQFHIILGGKITALEENIKSLESVLEDNIEQNLQKDKNIKDLKNELKKERENNEDLEEELNIKESKVEYFEKSMKTKEFAIDDLEKTIGERDQEINQQKENNMTLAKQVDEGIKAEKKVEIQNKIIKELKDNLKNKVERKNVDISGEINVLIQDIERLQRENKEKETLLENVNGENETLMKNLEILEAKTEELLTSGENSEKIKMDNMTLSDELSHFNITKPFKCESCDNFFATRSDLRCHMINNHEKEQWKISVQEMERKLSEQKYNLVKDIYNLREKEFKEKQICKCRGICRINGEHHLHLEPVVPFTI